MSDDPSTDADTPSPVLRVVHGKPSPEDLAVIAAVLAAAGRSGAGEPHAMAAPSTWAAYWRQARPPMRPGPGAWRASARPR